MKSTRFVSPWFPVSSMVELMFKWRSDPCGSAIIKFPIPWEPKVLYATERWIRWEAKSRDTNKQWLGMLFGLLMVIGLSGVQFGWLTKSDLIKTEYDYQLKWMTWCSVANRPFARWCHFTTTTRIDLLDFAFLCKLGLLFSKPHWEYQARI